MTMMTTITTGTGKGAKVNVRTQTFIAALFRFNLRISKMKGKHNAITIFQNMRGCPYFDGISPVVIYDLIVIADQHL